MTDKAGKVKVGTLFSATDIARIDRFGASLDVRSISRSAVVRELALRALDAIDEEAKATRKSGGKGRAS